MPTGEAARPPRPKGSGGFAVMTPTEKLIGHLEAQGFAVHGIVPARGYWTHAHQDVQRFQARVTFPGQTAEAYVGSWDTITACARRGIEPVQHDRGDVGGIVAKPRKVRK